MRSGINVQYSHSPREFASELVTWRAFRHLSVAAVMSYLSFRDNQGIVIGRSVATNPRDVWYERLEDHNTAAGFFHEFAVICREQGFGDQINNFVTQWRSRGPRAASEKWPLIFLPAVTWFREPNYAGSLVTLIARKLGVSCYLCGKVSRGWDALLEVEEMGVNSHPFKPLCTERLSPSALIRNCRHGHAYFQLNVYCRQCKINILNLMRRQSRQSFDDAILEAAIHHAAATHVQA